jgi:hypothetical protein
LRPETIPSLILLKILTKFRKNDPMTVEHRVIKMILWKNETKSIQQR